MKTPKLTSEEIGILKILVSKAKTNSCDYMKLAISGQLSDWAAIESRKYQDLAVIYDKLIGIELSSIEKGRD